MIFAKRQFQSVGTVDFFSFFFFLSRVLSHSNIFLPNQIQINELSFLSQHHQKQKSFNFLNLKKLNISMPFSRLVKCCLRNLSYSIDSYLFNACVCAIYAGKSYSFQLLYMFCKTLLIMLLK